MLHHIRCSVLVAATFGLSAAWANSAKTEWLLVQNHCDRGKMTIYVSPDAVKVISERCGYHLLTRGPKWTVYCFRPDEKTVWTGPMTQFCGNVLYNPTVLPGKNRTVLKAAGTGTLAGVKYTKYKSPGFSRETEYGADDIAVNPMIAEFFGRFYDCPDVGKVLLYRINDHGQGRSTTLNEKGQWLARDLGTDLRGGAIVEIETQSVRKVNYKASDFDIPMGYRKIADITSVAYSSKQKDSLTEVMGNIGFTYRDKDNKKKTAPTKAQPNGSH